MYTIKEILEYVQMPAECSELALACLERVEKNEEFVNLKQEFYKGGFSTGLIDELAEKLGERPFMLRMAFCLFCTDTMYEIFKEKGISDEVYLDSLIDLRIWAYTCMKNYGEWGMREFPWLANALRGELFRLGRLQFEYTHLDHCGYDKHGVDYKEGDTVIGVHIPEDGRMTAEERLDSYKKAYKMFGNPVFICETYLFYPKQYNFLPPNSNIVSFMNEFDIVYSEEDRSMKDMWRIFGLRDNYDPSGLPRETSLQRAYADHISKTGKNGMGYGVMVFNGEKINDPENDNERPLADIIYFASAYPGD